MRKILTSLNFSMIGLAIMLTLGSSSLAQTNSNSDSLPKNAAQWNQEEHQLRLLHYDTIYKSREVPKGSKVYKLPQGSPIAAFNAGGEKEKLLKIL